MAKTGLYIALIFGFLHLCLCQNCVPDCKTQYSDALTSKTSQNPDCIGLAGYVGCLASCKDAAEIQAASNDLNELCNAAGAQTSGGMSAFQSPEFQSAMTQCPALAICFASADMSSVDFTNIQELCSAMRPAITCMKNKLGTCSDLSGTQKSTVSSGVEQLGSVCQGGGVQLEVVKQWMAGMGAKPEDVSKVESCQAVKNCATKHTIDTSKLMQSISGSEIDMKAMCQLISPLYTCTGDAIKTCDVNDDFKQRFSGAAQMISMFCQSVKSGANPNSYNDFARMIMAQGQGSGLSSLNSEACSKWMTCLSNAQTPVATDQDLSCSQLKSVTACYDSSADGCDMAKQFKPIADQAKMNYKDKCSAGSQFTPLFSVILALLALIYAVSF